MEKRISILLIDDHAMVIEGMKAILQLIPTVQVKATAGNAFEAMDALKQHEYSTLFLRY
jgi:DNA-binding NarL/FixJ family response regulator